MSVARRIRLAIAAAAVALPLLAGCAADGGHRTLRLGTEDLDRSQRILWPRPPEVPRYLYAGQLIGEANFQAADAPVSEGIGGFLRWFAGILIGEKEPVVLQRPSTGTVDAAGRIYVADTSRQGVFVFDPVKGALDVWDKAEGLANFVAPAGLAIKPDGTALVADAELGIVARLDARGNPARSFGRGVLNRPTGLAYDPQGRRVFVADTYAHDIKVFDDDGQLLKVLGRQGAGDGEFNFPSHLAFAHGQLYVTDTFNSRIQVLSPDDGALRLKFGERGLYIGNMVRPKGVAVDNAGNIYVVESYHDHLLIFDKLGRFLMAIGGLGRDIGKFYLPAGVWTDRRDRIFVADMFNGRVMVFQFLGGGADGEY